MKSQAIYLENCIMKKKRSSICSKLNLEKIGKIFDIKLYFRYPKSAKVVKLGVLHMFNSSQA